MHIKTVNTHSKYKCIVMRGNDPGRVNRGKGYRAVNRLSCCSVLPGANGVYLGSNLGRPDYFSHLLFGPILAICRSPQYKVDGWLGPRGMLSIDKDLISCGSGCYLAGLLSYIPFEVPSPNQFFHKEFQALALIGFVAMVPMIITP